MEKPKFVVIDVDGPGVCQVFPDNDADKAGESYETHAQNTGTVLVFTPEEARKLGEALIKIADGGEVPEGRWIGGTAELVDADWEEEEDEDE